MIRRCGWSCVCAALATLCAVTPMAQGQERGAAPNGPTAGAQAQPDLDAKTREVLDRMTRHLGRGDSLRFFAKLKFRIETPERKDEVETSYKVASKAPNKLAMIAQGPPGDITTISDGKELITYVPAIASYIVQEAPESILEILTDEGSSGDPARLFIASMAAEDPQDLMLQGVTSGRHVGTETLNGMEADRLTLSTPELSWDMWVRKGDDPAVLRIRPDMAKAVGENMPGAQIEMTIDYSDWQIGDVPDDAFAFNPPEGVKKVRSFREALGIPEPPPHPLLGRQAPPMQLNLLGGGQANLADHKGKDVVILDFWATWCPPCRVGLPILAAVAKEFQDQNVVLYAVNVGESPEVVKAFIQSEKLDIKVPLDADSSVGRRYQAEGLPQTMIIDKQGRVQVVHLGVPGNFDRRLRREIKAVIAGKNLADQ